MDIPIFPTSGDAKPRHEVHIETLEIKSYPDRFRVWVHLVVTPFQDRPNLLLIAHDEEDQIVSELNVIETMHHDMEFTMHIRGKEDPAGLYTLTADLFYETRNPPQDQRVETFVVPEATDDS